MKTKKLVITIIIIIVAVVITGFIAAKIFQYVVKDITEREVARITQGEVDRITQEEIERITGEKNREVTNHIMGSDTADYQCVLTPKAREFVSPLYYTGPLIDSHVHMPVFSKIVSTVAIQSGFQDMPSFEDELTIDYIICLFDGEGIKNSFGFYLVPNPVIGSTIRGVKDIEKKYPEKITEFYMPTQLPGLNPSPSKFKEILDDNKGLFKGYGEVKFAFFEIENQEPDDPEYLESYSIADYNNLIIMMHPNPNNIDVVESILKSHPNTIFLFHGLERAKDEIINLIKNYENAYYSIDAVMTYIYGWDYPKHETKGPTKEEYLAYIRENFDSVLNEAVDEWKPLIEEYPNKFMWGTDRWYSWHFDYEVGGLLEEMGRSFIGQLDPAVQEKFAYKNAERLLQN